MIRIKKGFVASAAIVVAGFVVVAGILLFDSSSGKAKTDKAPQWVEQAGEGLMAPACASSLPETITCVGVTPQVILKAPNDSAKTCNFDVHISKIVGGVAIQVKPMDNIPDVFGVLPGGTISYTFNAENNTYYTWDFFDQGNPGSGLHCLGTGNYDKRMSAGVFSTPTCPAGGKAVNLTAAPPSRTQGSADFNVVWNFTSGSGALLDWIGMFLGTDPDSASPVEWHYNALGSDTGSKAFESSYAPGTYNFRYFEATLLGGDKLGTSNSVAITLPGCLGTDTNPHSICQSNSCVSVAGCGATSCASDVDCGACPIGQTNPHSTCVGNACVLTASCGATSCSSNADCTPPPVFDFSLSNSGPKSVIQGNSVQNLITANLLSGTAERIDFSVPGLPGATLSFSNPPFCNPNWSNCSKTLTISTTLSTPPGDYVIIVSGESIAITRTTQFVLTVNQAPPCADGKDNDGDGFTDADDPSCNQSDDTTEYSACNDLNSYPGGTPKDNDGDVDANINDKGCHSDGNTNNPASYDPNDNDESNTIFREVFVPFEKLLAMLFARL